MGRWVVDSFTTASIPANTELVTNRSIAGNIVNVGKIKVVPSLAGGTTEVKLFEKHTAQVADLAYATLPFSGNLVDPIEDDGAGVTNERAMGFLVPYEDTDFLQQMHVWIRNNSAVAKTYDVTITYEVNAVGGVGGVPDGLVATAQAAGLVIHSQVTATKNTAGLLTGEFRALYVAPGGSLPKTVDLRTVAEGGTFPVVSDATHIYQIGILTDYNGASTTFTSAAAGRWYYAWRMNNAAGFSSWTDGNPSPQLVTQYIDTTSTATANIGPPADWTVTLEAGNVANTVIVHATRPATNGKILLYWAAQIKDGDTGTWQLIDANASPTESSTHLDGSSFTSTVAGVTITKDAGNWPAHTVVAGDIVLVDTRGTGVGTFDVQHCVAATVKAIGSNTITLDTLLNPTPKATTGLVLKVIHPMWEWTTGGYLGNESNHGYWDSRMGADSSIFGDTKTQEFVSPPIDIPASVTNPEARVFFNNDYSVADDGANHSTGLTGGTGTFGPRSFTNFADRKYFIPVYPAAGSIPGDDDWGTLVFNSNGSITMASAATQQLRSGAAGVRPRFLIFPDLKTHKIQIKVTFGPIVMPNAFTNNNNVTFAGLMLFDASQFGIGAGIYTQQTNNWFAVVTYNLHTQPSPTAVTHEALVGAVPATSLTVDLTWQAKINAGTATEFYMTDAIRNVDGAGDTPIVGGTDIAQQTGNQPQALGLSTFLGLMASGSNTAVTATLTKFQIIQGFCWLQ